MSALREIAEPFVVAPPAGVRVRTRLRVSGIDAAVLREVGEYLGSLASADLAARCAEGRLDVKQRARSRQVRKQELTAKSSSRWAGALTRTSEDAYQLAHRNLLAERRSLLARIKRIETRLAVAAGKRAGRVRGYPTAAERHAKTIQIHRYDPDTDLDETLGALSDLVRAGKVRYIGHSTFPVSAIVEAQWTARERARERFVCEQPPYSVLTRAIEADVLPTCQRYGMGVIPYSPLAGGWLSGRYRQDSEVTGPASYARQRLVNRFDMSLPENQRKLEAAEQLAELAEGAGLTLIELAIAFVLRHPAVTAAIIGPRTMEHLESQLAAAGAGLSDDVLDRIDAIVPPGVTINPADNGWVSPALDAAARRR